MIVVCKKYRLIEKTQGKFTQEHKKPLRSRVILEESYVEKENKLSEITGILYVVDKAATKKRDEKINPKPEKKESQEK
jgi:hypothetical protein